MAKQLSQHDIDRINTIKNIMTSVGFRSIAVLLYFALIGYNWALLYIKYNNNVWQIVCTTIMCIVFLIYGSIGIRKFFSK